MMLLAPFENKFTIKGEWSGLHLLLTAKEDIREEQLVKRAADEGVRVYAMSDNLVEKTKTYEGGATILLGYANLTDKEMEKGITLLKKAWL